MLALIINFQLQAFSKGDTLNVPKYYTAGINAFLSQMPSNRLSGFCLLAGVNWPKGGYIMMAGISFPEAHWVCMRAFCEPGDGRLVIKPGLMYPHKKTRPPKKRSRAY